MTEYDTPISFLQTLDPYRLDDIRRRVIFLKINENLKSYDFTKYLMSSCLASIYREFFKRMTMKEARKKVALMDKIIWFNGYKYYDGPHHREVLLKRVRPTHRYMSKTQLLSMSYYTADDNNKIVSLRHKTVKELTDLCRMNKIKGYSKLNKSDKIKALIKL